MVVCAYNGAATLEECLRSLLALDYPEFEVIAIDDRSDDHTGEIMERVAREFESPVDKTIPHFRTSAVSHCITDTAPTRLPTPYFAGQKPLTR